MYKIAIASDHGGLELKEEIKKLLSSKDTSFIDLGTHSSDSCDYPYFAKAVVNEILSGNAERGILICGTGQGMAICANRYKGIRAAVCTDTFTAHATREHNDSNILCLGQRVTGKSLATDIVLTWLNAKFEGERHKKRLDLIDN